MQLLPASAAAFAPRCPPNVVLNTKVEPWLTATLKRTNKVKRPLNSAPQHTRCLTETLSSASAIWTLCAIMLPKAPESELRQDDNPLVEALFNYQLLQIEAYVVHVDLVLHDEVAFKLTPETIESLVEYHKDIYSVDIAAKTIDWTEKPVQVKKLHEEFVQSVNKFVYRTGALALEGLEEDGAGELLCGRSEEVKNAIMGLFLPLLPPPPPPPVVEPLRPAMLLPSNSPSLDSAGGNWWSQSMLLPTQTAAVDQSWKVVPSSPSHTAMSAEDTTASLWSSLGFDSLSQYPSPASSYSQPICSADQFYSEPEVSCSLPQFSYALPLPSLLMSAAQQCGTSAGFGGFGWDRYSEYTSIM